MISILVFLASCNACNPPPVDPPPCDPGAAYTYHNANFNTQFGYPASVVDLVNEDITTVTLGIFTNNQTLFDEFKAWVNLRWNKSVSNCSKSYRMTINLARSPFAAAANLEVERIITPPSGSDGAADHCGDHGPGDMTFSKIIIFNNGSCPQNITAAHEFGHDMGFEDAYNELTTAPLHSQTSDIMTAFGSVVFGAHGRILAEKYGN